MQVLVHLASHPNEVLSKDRLLEAVWHNTFVGDDVLVRCISEIRYVFGDDPKSSRVIQTIPKGGYRLIGTVTTENSTDIEPKESVISKSNGLLRFGLETVPNKESNVVVADPRPIQINVLSHAASGEDVALSWTSVADSDRSLKPVVPQPVRSLNRH